ncbi:GTPase Era [Desulfothermus okinawensis JCM 13304]
MGNYSEQKEFRCGIVALIGPPNAGKSTLLNSYIGQKISIVTPKPQTTRNRINGILHTDQCQIVFLDTPGIHKSNQTLNRFLVETAWQALSGTDVVLLMIDGSRYIDKLSLLEKEISPLIKPIKNHLDKTIIAINKIDKIKNKNKFLPIMELMSKYFPDVDIYLISALTGEGSFELLEEIKKRLPVGPPLFPEDQISSIPLRFMAAEIIREKLFLKLEKELPYSVAVDIEHWEEDKDKNLTKIHATIYVSKKNHKQIVIGSKGSKLKEIGTLAREELEAVLGTKVYLNLWVKVKEKWNEDERFIANIYSGEF